MNNHRVLLIALISLLVAVGSKAQIPRTISYQGLLCDASGAPRTDNTYDITFRLYESSTGGSAVWTETQSVQTTRGLFSALLGSGTPFGVGVTFDKPYWLGVQVGSEAELSPRLALSSAPFSFNAVNADTAGNAVSVLDGAITTGKLADGAVSSAKIGNGQVVKSLNSLKDDITLQAGSNVSIGASGNTLTISASGGGGGTVTGSGSAGQVAFWTGSSSLDGDNGIFWDNSNKRLGIGTTSPSYPFHVRSTADWVAVGEATASSGDVWGGVFYAPNSSTGRGVYGGGNYMGVYGTAPATSGSNFGVYGISASSSGTGVRGYAQSGSGNTRGVSGESASGSGVGVYGASNGSGTAVFAESKEGGPALRAEGGAVLFSGSTGATPTSGAGSRLMWIPAKSAFRAGYVAVSQWDDANIGNYSIAMGQGTSATATGSTAMGQGTTASGVSSTAMGSGSTASGGGSTAIGPTATASGTYSCALGAGTTASGSYSTAIGHSTTASGGNSTALGAFVSTNSRAGSFIIGDASSTNIVGNSVDNQFVSIFAGGYRLLSDRTGTHGVYMNGGASGWTNISDRNKKENFRSIDGEQLLRKIRALPITRWSYRESDPSIQYIGPMAQDFYAAFHLGGSDSLGINSVCIDGVNMAAIQALEKRTAELREIAAEIETLKAELADVKARLRRLETDPAPQNDFSQQVLPPAERGRMQR